MEFKKCRQLLNLTHKAIGAEVRRGPYDFVVDDDRVGLVEMSNTVEIPIERGRHTLQVRNGRKSSSIETFDAADGEIVAFRCTGKEVLADLPGIFRRSQAGTEARSGLSHHCRRGTDQHVVSARPDRLDGACHRTPAYSSTGVCLPMAMPRQASGHLA